MKSMRRAGQNQMSGKNNLLRGLKQFQLLDDAWKKLTPLLSCDYRAGPFIVRLIFVNSILANKIMPALAHLICHEVDTLTPQLTIGIWDTETDHRKLPALDWQLICRNGYHGYSDNTVFLHYFDHIQAISALNLAENKAYYVVNKVDALPWWVSGSPLQIIFHAWLRANHFQLTHTAAIGNHRGAILLSGKGGSGKSTTVLSCLREGLHYIGEDYCVLGNNTTPTVYSIYQSAKWTLSTRHIFPDYENHIMNLDVANTEKALVYIADLFPEKIKLSLPIRAVIFLTVGTQSKPVIKKHSLQASLKELMMSTIIQLPFYHAKTIDILKKTLSTVMHYEMTLGLDINANVQVLRDILTL